MDNEILHIFNNCRSSKLILQIITKQLFQRNKSGLDFHDLNRIHLLIDNLFLYCFIYQWLTNKPVSGTFLYIETKLLFWIIYILAIFIKTTFIHCQTLFNYIRYKIWYSLNKLYYSISLSFETVHRKLVD